MDSKRKARREARLKEEIEKFRASRPKIQQQFADLKRSLATVSADEWENLPEPGQLTKRPKAQRGPAGFVPVPDAVLSKAHQQHEHYRELDARQQQLGGLATPFNGLSTPLPGGLSTPTAGLATPVQDLTQIGEARKVRDAWLPSMSNR